jgi:stage V sporulation protein G
MDVTEVRIYIKNGTPNLLAFANLTLDSAFAVRDLRVVNGKKGLFVSMPSRKTPDGKYLDVAFPVTKELRERIHAKVLEAYRKAAGGEA